MNFSLFFSEFFPNELLNDEFKLLCKSIWFFGPFFLKKSSGMYQVSEALQFLRREVGRERGRESTTTK